MKLHGDVRLAAKAVMVECREKDVMHRLASAEVTMQTSINALAEEPLYKRFPRRPLDGVWILFDVSGNSFP
jgi:hypothetical protein